MAKTPARKSKATAAEAKPVKAPAPKWSASKIETWSIDRIKPYDRNARSHPERQIKQIRSSLLRFGWTIPLLVRPNGTLIAGHGRLEAAKAEGFKTAPVIVARGWTEKECREYTLIDNKLAEGSKWDTGLRALEVSELAALGSDLSTFGLKVVDASAINTQAQLGGLKYAVVVRCTDEAQQGALMERLEKEGFECEALIS